MLRTVHRDSLMHDGISTEWALTKKIKSRKIYLMEKVVSRASLIKKNNWKKQDIILSFKYLLIFMLLCLSINCLSRCFAVGYVVPQDKYVFRGVLLIGVSFLILQG